MYKGKRRVQRGRHTRAAQTGDFGILQQILNESIPYAEIPYTPHPIGDSYIPELRHPDNCDCNACRRQR